MRGRWIWRAVKIGLIVTVAVVIFGFLVKYLWNWLMPPIFGWRAITFWQAAGILLLSKILFGGGFRGRGGMQWRSRMIERWEKMTPEERERFSRGMRGRCGQRNLQPEEQKA